MIYSWKKHMEQEALDGFNNVESKVQTNLSTNALLFMVCFAKEAIQLRKNGEYAPPLKLWIQSLKPEKMQQQEQHSKNNGDSTNDISSDDDENKSTNEVIISDDDSSDDEDQTLSYNNTTSGHSNINNHTQGVDGWSAQHTITFASIRALEKCIHPYWDIIARLLSLQSIIVYSTEQNEVEEGEMRLKLAKTMTSNVVKSPWGDASIAAQRIVNTKRDEKKVEAKTKHKLALRALERTQKCGTKLRKLEAEFHKILKKHAVYCIIQFGFWNGGVVVFNAIRKRWNHIHLVSGGHMIMKIN